MEQLNLFYKYKYMEKAIFGNLFEDKYFLMLSINFKNTHFCKRPILNKNLKVSQKCLKYSKNRSLEMSLAYWRCIRSYICHETKNWGQNDCSKKGKTPLRQMAWETPLNHISSLPTTNHLSECRYLKSLPYKAQRQPPSCQRQQFTER